MIRRVYYVFPHRKDCERIVNELLLHRIAINQMHVVANDDVDLGDLPEASIWQKMDIRHSLALGLVLGAYLGVVVGFAVHFYFNTTLGGFMAVFTLMGALFGAWGSSMVGMMAPNRELKPFETEIQKGKILLMVDVPKSKLEQVEATIEALHPNAKFTGVEPTIPPFP